MERATPLFQAPMQLGTPTFFLHAKSPHFATPILPKDTIPARRRRVTRSFIVALQEQSRSTQQADWNTLTPLDFDEKLASDNLFICLVGMSNCGKSHWSSQLQRRQGFSLVCVDDKIEDAIEPELSALGYSGIDGLAAWMGFPTDEKFVVHQQRYLDLEEAITASAIPGPGNTVLDTTGSVCYLSDRTLRRLKTDYLVVHLEASDDMLDVMTDRYFSTPKPVVWGDSFNRRDGEDAEAALRRCYPMLLRHRRERYAEIAHLAIPASESLSRQLDIEGFMQLLRSQLRERK